jgi:hypothetical protein
VSKKSKEDELIRSKEIQKLEAQKFRMQDQLKGLKENQNKMISTQEHEARLKLLQNEYEKCNKLPLTFKV